MQTQTDSLRTVSILSLLLLLSCSQLRAQNYSVYNSFYINPYLYNPAEAASKYAYGFVNFRRQWMGIEGAPTVATLNYNTLMDHKRAGFGVKISSYTRGILNTSEALVTYAYGVPLNPKNIIYFGISGGAGSTTIDASKASDATDIALANYPTGPQPSANFGFRWASSSGISLGAVLPQLFGPVYSVNQPSKRGVSPFDNMLFTFSFKREIESKKIINRSGRSAKAKLNTTAHYAPLEFYALYRYSSFGNNQVEGVMKYNLSDNLWLAMGYRQQYGIIPSLGFAWDQFIFCYSYEPGTQPQQGFSTGSHEIQLGIKFGREKKFKFKVPVLRSTLGATTVHHNPRFRERTTDQEEAAREEDKKRYYVVVKSFGSFDQAEEFKKKLVAMKYNGQIYYFPRNKQYYVYTYETTNASEANLEVKNLKIYTKLTSAKVLTVIEK